MRGQEKNPMTKRVRRSKITRPSFFSAILHSIQIMFRISPQISYEQVEGSRIKGVNKILCRSGEFKIRRNFFGGILGAHQGLSDEDRIGTVIEHLLGVEGVFDT